MRRGRPQDYLVKRGGFANRGRQALVAESRVSFVEKNKTNSAMRLQRDLKELLEAKEPLVGVSARPLPDNMYEWHGNLRGPAGSQWDKGVFHIKIEFPIEYPVNAPQITLYTTIPHPNVFGSKLCLDMLEPTGFGRWIPAYTVQSILIQLQSFLFEKRPEDIYMFQTVENKRAVEKANEFVCTKCEHKGPLSAWPPFNNFEYVIRNFIMDKTPRELLQSEITCFSTKMSLKESTMGIGISMKKSPRSGQFLYVNPTIDLLSMRAFTKLRIREALHREKFSHWLPLYFGENEVFQLEKKHHNHDLDEMVTDTKTVNLKERFEKHLSNSINFICNGQKDRPAKSDQIISMMTKLITTHIVDITKENRFISIVAIRRLINFIRLFLYLIEKDPSIQEKMDATLTGFINDPNKRLKDDNACPSLGDILVFVTMSSKFKIQDIMDFYIDEQLDRQVYWMLQKVPELDFQNKKLKNKGKVDEKERVKVCFECGRTGSQVTLFFYLLNKTIERVTNNKKINMQKFAQKLDENVGCMERQVENQFQEQLKVAQKLESFEDYYYLLGIKIEGGENGIYEMLVQAVKNSRQKQYHGDDNENDLRYKLPSIAEQSETRVLKLLDQFTIVNFVKEEIQQKLKLEKDDDQIQEIQNLDIISKKSFSSNIDKIQSQEKTYKLKVKSIELKNGLEDDQKWKKLCIENFDFIRQTIQSNKDRQATPSKLAQYDDYTVINQSQSVEKYFMKIDDKLYIQRNQLLGKEVNKYTQLTAVSDYDDETFTFKKLFVKLVFEYLMNDFEYNQNFEIIYEYIKLFVDDLSCIKINIIDKTSLKSNHYWLMAIIPKLKKLKSLKIYMDQDKINQAQKFDQNGFKFLQKSINFFYKNGGDLTKFEILAGLNQTSEELMYQIFKPMMNIQVIKFVDFDLSLNDCKAVGKVLSDFLHIKELEISNSQIGDQHAKEIADGLMRSKNIEVLKLRNNPNLVCDQILYNLAFSPKIRHIDLTNVPNLSSKESAEAIYKLLKISGSIQVLLLGRTDIAKSLTQDFYIALGESKSLQTLNIDCSKESIGIDNISLPNLKLLGKACALNAKRNGCLQDLQMKKIIGKYKSLEQFFESFYVSDYDNELWYGDKNVAKEMKKEQLVNNLHFGLLYLDLGDSQIDNSKFRLKDYEIQKEPNWPFFIKLLSKVKLQQLHLPNSNIDEKTSEVLAVAIGKNPDGMCQNLQILNLCKNKIGIEGAKLLAPALEANQSIQYLDLSQNQLMVYGVTLIAKSLMQNSVLKGLNLFKNQFDVDGARALRDLLIENRTLEFLDIGHNRIRQKGLETIAYGIQNAKETNLKSLGLRLNFINDNGFKYFFEDVVFSGISKLENLYIRENNLSHQQAQVLYQKLIEQNSQIYVDQFEKQDLLKEERTKKTIWYGPVDVQNLKLFRRTIKDKLLSNKYGLNKYPIRFKYGRKVGKKPSKNNVYMFVEYEDDKSINLVTRFMKKAMQSGIYLAGTNTFTKIFKSKKGQYKSRKAKASKI